MITKDGEPIPDLETWSRVAGPKSVVQWKDGRSAKESARAWLGAAPDLPREIAEVLESHPDFSGLLGWTAEPEAQVRFDSFRGEPSNVDVLLKANDRDGPLVVAIEAKADESFGGTVGQTLRRATTRLEASPRSKGVARCHQLVAALLGSPPDQLSDVDSLRYQLLAVSAAALSEAARVGSERAVVLVHEFVTSATADDRHAANQADLDRFVTLLANESREVEAGQVVGPLSIPGAPLLDEAPALYIGKASRNLRVS